MPNPYPITEAEIEVVKDPNRWAQWPVLPILRRQPGESSYEVGVIYEAGLNSGPNRTPALFFYAGQNMHTFDPKAPREELPTLEAITKVFDDGWQLDD
jgi:hypothetical protein